MALVSSLVYDTTLMKSSLASLASFKQPEIPMETILLHILMIGSNVPILLQEYGVFEGVWEASKLSVC